MQTALVVLNVVMAVALWWKPGCKRFAAIQCAQLFEIWPMMHAPIEHWILWYHINAGVNLIAVCFARNLPVAMWLMLAWSALVECLLESRDCAFQIRQGTGFPSDAIYWLGNVVLLVLLFYALSKPTLWLKEQYARRST